jgi:hypothetical protein
VDAGIFHDFHHAWIEEIKRALNRGVLPSVYYALAEQIAGGPIPDVLTLQRPAGNGTGDEESSGACVAVATAPPKVRYHTRLAEDEQYAWRAARVVIRHRSGHEVIAMIEIVSPGNKNSRSGLNRFVKKSAEALQAGIHLVVVDLFPPTPRDPQGIHKAIWDEVREEPFTLPEDKPLTLAAYIGGPLPEAFVEPVAVGDRLVDMPVFLTPEDYVPVPLESTYQAAWEAVPRYWRDVVSGAREHS